MAKQKTTLATSSAAKDKEQLQLSYIVGRNANYITTCKIVANYKIYQCHLVIYPRKRENICPQKDLYVIVYSL